MNDLALLEQVANPVAVDPDPNLRAEAEKRGWPVISLLANGATRFIRLNRLGAH
jgi:phosphoserine phosphatase